MGFEVYEVMSIEPALGSFGAQDLGFKPSGSVVSEELTTIWLRSKACDFRADWAFLTKQSYNEATAV